MPVTEFSEQNKAYINCGRVMRLLFYIASRIIKFCGQFIDLFFNLIYTNMHNIYI